MSYRCYICNRPPRGFLYLDPNRVQETERLLKTHKSFCSLECQQIHYQMLRKGVEVNKTDLERKALMMVFDPLADYIVEIGMEKGVGHYTKEEAEGLVDTVLEAYHDALQELYKTEVPF